MYYNLLVWPIHYGCKRTTAMYTVQMYLHGLDFSIFFLMKEKLIRVIVLDDLISDWLAGLSPNTLWLPFELPGFRSCY